MVEQHLHRHGPHLLRNLAGIVLAPHVVVQVLVDPPDFSLGTDRNPLLTPGAAAVQLMEQRVGARHRSLEVVDVFVQFGSLAPVGDDEGGLAPLRFHVRPAQVAAGGLQRDPVPGHDPGFGQIPGCGPHVVGGSLGIRGRCRSDNRRSPARAALLTKPPPDFALATRSFRNSVRSSD